jgi:proteasome accessory factor C
MVKNISAPLVRTARLLDLVPFLNSHQGISIKDLAAEFEVSQSQITADLTTLWMCGLPGYTPLELMDLEFESGFVTIRNAETLSKPRTISFDEALALLLGLDILKTTISPDRQDLIEIAESLAMRISSKVGVPRTIQLEPNVKPEVMTVVKQAISRKIKLTIKYHSLYSDLVKERIISPNEIFEKDGHLYLQAFCFTADAGRTFRLDRIVDLTILAEDATAATSATSLEQISFSVHVHTVRRDLAERFNVSIDVDNPLIKSQSYSGQWIVRSVFAGGADCELLQPQGIRQEVLAKAQALLDRYKMG